MQKYFLIIVSLHIINCYGLKVNGCCNEANSQLLRFKWYGKRKTREK